MARVITEAECGNCRKYLVEKIEGVEKRTNILLGTSLITIVLLALELFTRVAK